MLRYIGDNNGPSYKEKDGCLWFKRCKPIVRLIKLSNNKTHFKLVGLHYYYEESFHYL